MADIFTSLTATGTEAELIAMLHVLQKYAHDRKEQYKENHDCWYLDSSRFDVLSEETVAELIGGGTLCITIPGPYGIINDPDNAYNCLFTDLADAAPLAHFEIRIEGFDAGGNVSATALLREGKLYFNTDYREFNSTDEEPQPEDNAGGKILAGEGEKTVLAGFTFVVTGELKKFKNRNALTIYIEERGGKVGSSVSKKTSFLINNNKRATTAKDAKARELGIPILTEKEFLEKFALDYRPRRSKQGKLYESGYYDPISRKFQPPRKLKKEPLTIQIIIECADQSRHTLQLDFDVEDYVRMSCTPEGILACKSLDDLEQLLLDSVTDCYSKLPNKDDYVDKWKVTEFKSLLSGKWPAIRKAVGSMENIDRIILRRIDARNSVRFISWANLFHEELKDLTKKAALCKAEQKAENAAALETYLDAQQIWFPWAESPGWPTWFCGRGGRAMLDWRSLTDDAELFAKLIVTEEISDLDHGEETTIVNFRTKEYQQSAWYFPGW